MCRVYFRGDSAAASLKPERGGPVLFGMRHFRGDSAAASLKPAATGRELSVDAHFRGDSAAASLKRDVGHFSSPVFGISAAIPPRPH